MEPRKRTREELDELLSLPALRHVDFDITELAEKMAGGHAIWRPVPGMAMLVELVGSRDDGLGGFEIVVRQLGTANRYSVQYDDLTFINLRNQNDLERWLNGDLD